jgi:hypothetical protein
MRVRELGAARAAQLRRLVAPFILRREKDKVLGGAGGSHGSDGGDGGDGSSANGRGSAATAASASREVSSSSSSSAATAPSTLLTLTEAGSTGAGGAAGRGVVAAAAAAAAAAPAGSASGPAAGAPAPPGGAPRPAAMGSKTDLVVWLRLTPLQRHIYEAFLHSDAVKEALNSTRSPLAALTVLKKVCDHPALLSERATKAVVAGGARRGGWLRPWVWPW